LILDDEQLAQPGTDRIAVIQLFEAEADMIGQVLSGLPNATRWLSRSKGAAASAPLLDVNVYSLQHLRVCFDTLTPVWAGTERRKPRWVANATRKMLNHIRNNMFHGIKAPEDAADVDSERVG
jgi:hypothetical protein